MEQKRDMQKQTHTNIVNLSFTEKQKQFNGERTVFSTNSTGTTGYLHAREKKNESRHRPYL